MDLKTNSSALVLIRQLIDTHKTKEPRIQTPPQKPRAVLTPVKSPFPRCAPEEEGVESRRVCEFFDTLGSDKSLDMHSVLVIRNGRVIGERDFGAYDMRLWHISYSECKSIVGLAIGMLIDEGKLELDEKPADIFQEKISKLQYITHKNMTIRHLLTMSCEIGFNEAGSVTEMDWVSCFFASKLSGELGAKFEYNSMCTYMLSAIVREKTGQSLMEYLKPRLWEPLDIAEVFWETCPKGIEKGGWGLYLRPEDFAKIGLLVLQKGKWKGRQLVSEKWIEESTTAHMTTPPQTGANNYGYQLWVGRDEHTFLFNGMFGQNVIGYFDTGVIIVTTAGNVELFQQSTLYEHVDAYFGHGALDREIPQKPDYTNPFSMSRLRKNSGFFLLEVAKKQGSRRTMKMVETLCQMINGKKYTAEAAEAAALGLYPFYAQALHNNYTKGLTALSFAYREEKLILTVMEADEEHVLPVGFEGPEYTELSFHGEPERVGVTGILTEDEDGRAVVTIRVSFLELACARILRLTFERDHLLTRWTEKPGKDYLLESLQSLVTGKRNLLGTVLSKMDDDLVKFKINAMLEPEITLTESGKGGDEKKAE